MIGQLEPAQIYSECSGVHREVAPTRGMGAGCVAVKSLEQRILLKSPEI